MTLITGKIRTDGNGGFVDTEGRTIQLKGINLDGGSKFPREPCFPSHRPVKSKDSLFFDGDNVSFVGRPFPVDQAADHFKRIKALGYNVVRYIITWEAIEHEGPGIYDDEFISYTVEILKIIQKIGGLYIIIDPHQDVWSRYTGGDGAPMWTLYAAGFDPKCFHKTEAAVVENYFPEDPDKYPKMLWPTNYKRLVAGTMFVLFFAGKVFAPKAIINGVNIQEFLQTHFIDSIAYFVEKVFKSDPSLFEETILGIETINEPNSGFLGTPKITEVPKEQNLRVGTCPTILQALKLGMGFPQNVDEYVISVTGPKKTGTKHIDPEGTIAWLENPFYDEAYEFKRDEEWQLGRCIWAQHGVWDIEKQKELADNYFSTDPNSGELVDEDVFINRFFVDYFKLFKNAVRKIVPDTIIFMQPPPLQIPPNLKGTELLDDNVVFCPHYYDGMSLMFKSWNRKYNVNTLGIMRHRYSHPMFGMVFGEGNIRKCFREQLSDMKKECKEYLGENISVIFTEIGMPFDMDHKKAYENDDFSSQTSALDALGFALEGSNLSHTWWCYTAENCHKWGDRFNCEDFSFWSRDDDFGSSLLGSKTFQSLEKPTKNVAHAGEETVILPGSSSASELNYKFSDGSGPRRLAHTQILNGLRAANATIRPYSLGINGTFVSAEFDLKKVAYTLKIVGFKNKSLSTRIYLPKWHYPPDSFSIEQSSGAIQYDENLEVLEWSHEAGEQAITIRCINSNLENEENWSGILMKYFPCWE